MAELGEVASFYEAQLVGLGTSFSTEVQSSVGFFRTYPDAGSPLGRNLRKVVIKRLPYSVIYRHEEHCIYIVAVAHHRRRPGYWKGR